jgi:hypothetical protein
MPADAAPPAGGAAPLPSLQQYPITALQALMVVRSLIASTAYALAATNLGSYRTDLLRTIERYLPRPAPGSRVAAAAQALREIREIVASTGYAMAALSLDQYRADLLRTVDTYLIESTPR